MPNSRASVLHGEIEKLFNAFLLKKYPIGSVIISLNNQNPENYIGGKWELIPNDTFLASKGITAAGNVGGDNNAKIIKHTHKTVSGDGKHTHGVWTTNNVSSNCSGFAPGDDGRPLFIGCLDGDWTGQYCTHIAPNRGGQQVLNDTTGHTHNVAQPDNSVEGTNQNMPKYLACYIFKRYA